MIFLHGNNDTPFPTLCNGLAGKIHDLAQAFVDRGYSPSEVWGLGYQGDQCDLAASPTNRSTVAHTTAANVEDLAHFVHAVLEYTGAKRVDIVGHSLGGTLAREWLRRDHAYHLVRHLVTIASPHHGIIDCSPSPLNYFALDALGGFNPNSAICVDLGAADTPFPHASEPEGDAPRRRGIWRSGTRTPISSTSRLPTGRSSRPFRRRTRTETRTTSPRARRSRARERRTSP